jgi:hypothetical protein
MNVSKHEGALNHRKYNKTDKGTQSVSVFSGEKSGRRVDVFKTTLTAVEIFLLI